LKSLRFILALVILLAPVQAARAQVSVGTPAATPQPAQPAPTSVSPLPPSANDAAVVEDVLPREEEQPTLGHQGVLVEALEGHEPLEVGCVACGHSFTVAEALSAEDKNKTE